MHLQDALSDIAEIRASLDRNQTYRGFRSMAIGVSACLLYTSPSPRDRTRSRMPSSA